MESPEPQRYEDRYQNMQCAYCEKWANRGVMYGDHFLCETHEDDGDALSIVAHKLSEEAKTDIRLTADEIEWLFDVLEPSSLYDSPANEGQGQELSCSIRDKLELCLEMRKRELAANHQE